MVMLISVFVKIVNNEGPFHLQWYGGENEIICWHVKSACIRRFSGPYSVQMRENTDQKNSEYDIVNQWKWW